MAVDDLVIRIGGESGEGIVTTGEILSRIAAFSGYEIFTFRTYPAEILGGHVMYQMRVSTHPVGSRGDALDILLAMNQEGYDRHHGELRKGGIVVFDETVVEIPEDNDHVLYPIPFTDLAKSMKFLRGKNLIAIGAMTRLMQLPFERAQEIVKRRLGKKVELLENNLKSLELGYKYVEEHMLTTGSEEFELPAVSPERDRLILNGNEAAGMGSIAGGLQFYSGYPITPASSVMEFIAAHLPKIGGYMVQVEDEIAAINMAIGGSFAGARSMTATSGPGVSLMAEALGMASMAEIPVVVLDVQRVGPSTGMPTKTDQGDLNLALYGSHGEGPRFVLAPINVEDTFYQMVNAFNAAERYQVPVIVLTDQGLSAQVEAVDVFPEKVELLDRVRPDLEHLEGRYYRYQVTENGISPMSVPGQAGGQYTAESLEHKITGAPSHEADNRIVQVNKRFRKVETARKEMVEWPRIFIKYGDENPEIGVMGWGTTCGAAKEAVERARAKGIKAAVFYTKLLSPLPVEQLKEFAESAQVILVPELNYTGQYAHLLRAELGIEPEVVHRYDGLTFTAGEILAKIEEIHAGLTGAKA